VSANPSSARQSARGSRIPPGLLLSFVVLGWVGYHTLRQIQSPHRTRQNSSQQPPTEGQKSLGNQTTAAVSSGFRDRGNEPAERIVVDAVSKPETTSKKNSVLAPVVPSETRRVPTGRSPPEPNAGTRSTTNAATSFLKAGSDQGPASNKPQPPTLQIDVSSHQSTANDPRHPQTAGSTAEISTRIENQTIRDFGKVVFRGTIDLQVTLDRIACGTRNSHRNDGATFGNREGRLPRQSSGYYTEYVHPTVGMTSPGPQRVIVGQDGEIWYTPDHYKSFQRVK
jgi:guanyl-specific ribonuclease Sa